jgi:hypothetical protein
MRHLLIILWWLLPLTLLAQQPFAPIGATWYDDVGGFGLPIEPQAYTLYEAKGDTMVNGQLLRQVGPFLLHIDSGNVSLWAEDSLHLIYDFTVSTGDSVLFQIPNQPQTYFSKWTGMVVHDTMIALGAVLLKRITCEVIQQGSVGSSSPFQYQYMERIGVLTANPGNLWRAAVPIAEPSTLVDPEGWYPFFRCYEDNSISYQSESFQTFGLPCDYQKPVSIAHAEADGWQVYPNPSEGPVMVSAPTAMLAASYQIRVLGLQGRIARRVQAQPAQTALHLDGLAPGLYLVQVFVEEELVHTQRLVRR